MTQLVSLGIEYFPDPTKGKPVFFGSIYVGDPDTDPEIESNQKSVTLKEEDGTLVSVSQPVATGAGGVPLYNGSPVQILTDGNYSLKVLNKSGKQVYYVPNFFEGTPLTEFDGRYIVPFDTVADMVASTTLVLDTDVFVRDYGTGYGSGPLRFKVVAAATGTDDGGEYIDLPNTTPALQAQQLFPGGKRTFKMWGARANGSNSDYNAMLAAYAASVGQRLTATVGIYIFETGLSATCETDFEDGAIFKPVIATFTRSAGINIIASPDQQIFDGSAGGLFLLNYPAFDVYPEWFGATGDKVTNDDDELQLMCDSNPSVIHLISEYLTDTTIDVNPNTHDSFVPEIIGDGAEITGIVAGALLGTNPVLYHQGSSPGPNKQWGNFYIEGTNGNDGQWGVHSVNTTFMNYDNMMFFNLDSWVRFENLGAGFSEQNVFSNCWGSNCKYGYTMSRQSGSTKDSFRGTGFASNCHMDLTTVSGARLVRAYLLNSLDVNNYDAPCYASVWVNATSAVYQNDGNTPIRASGHLTYESSANGWVMGTGSALTTDTFRGNIDGISFNPLENTMSIRGLVNGDVFTDNGTFTPVLGGTGSDPTVTYAANGQQGIYEVIGSQVFVSIILNITSYSGGAGNLLVRGLPFTSRAGTGGVPFSLMHVHANKLTFSGLVKGKVQDNGTDINVVETLTTLDEAAITLASLATANSTIFVHGSYTRL